MAMVRLRLSVVALFVDGDQVLLLHQMTPPEPDCWDLPGGGLDPAEDLISGLRREVREETGIGYFTIVELLTAMEGFYPLANETVHAVSLIYRCRIEPRPEVFTGDPDEVGPGGVRWWAIADLPLDRCSSRARAALVAAGFVAAADSTGQNGG
ncbi:hypothetical protein C7271_13825 [filamentous cyanobacterium CCP5]|nr:hypothetical protein C7271_13825 [filamentous cyanobacterium CCP5]